MQVKTPEVKRLIIDCLLFEDRLDEKGNHMRRVSFPKSHFRGISSAKTKLIESMELGMVPKDKKREDLKEEDIVWSTKEESTEKKDCVAFLERHTEVEIEFDDNETKAIKFVYGDRSDLTQVSVEALDEFEELIGLKPKTEKEEEKKLKAVK